MAQVLGFTDVKVTIESNLKHAILESRFKQYLFYEMALLLCSVKFCNKFISSLFSPSIHKIRLR